MPMLTRRAFTLIEMLTTVAVLIIVLGLMVSLARYVRDQSANQLTSALLQNLDAAVRVYADYHNDQLPAVEPLIADGVHPLPDEPTLHRTARRNNEQFLRELLPYLLQLSRTASPALSTPPHGVGDAPDPARPPASQPAPTTDELGMLPISIYDGVTLRDAWGECIVFMPHEHPAIGMASRDHPSFFFSAGPDHRYLTRDDNLYSYETAR